MHQVPDSVGVRRGQFRHQAVYNRELGRVEMHLVSRAPQTIRIPTLGLQIGFGEGETIHTENSYKYDLPQLDSLAREVGFRPDAVWLDSQERFSCHFLGAVD